MQKFLRVLAFLSFTALALSPLYLKFIRSHANLVKPQGFSFPNITEQLLEKNNSCSFGPTIELERSSDITLVHFFSLTCASCAKELENWMALPKMNLNIVHIITTNSLGFPENKAILTTLLSSKNNSSCLAIVEESELQEMKITSLPYSFLSQGGKILHTIPGKLDSMDVKTIILKTK